MHRFFGASKKAPTPTLQDAIQATDSRVDSIQVKVKRLDAELLRYREQLARLREGPAKQALKQRAMRVLQQKKMSLSLTVFNMEQTLFTTDNLKNTATTVEAMKTANQQLKQQYKSFNISQIETIQDEMEDLMELTNQLQEQISAGNRNYAVPDEIDEADLDAELEALGDELQEPELDTAYLDSISASTALPELEPLPEMATDRPKMEPIPAQPTTGTQL